MALILDSFFFYYLNFTSDSYYKCIKNNKDAWIHYVIILKKKKFLYTVLLKRFGFFFCVNKS